MVRRTFLILNCILGFWFVRTAPIRQYFTAQNVIVSVSVSPPQSCARSRTHSNAQTHTHACFISLFLKLNFRTTSLSFPLHISRFVSFFFSLSLSLFLSLSLSLSLFFSLSFFSSLTLSSHNCLKYYKCFWLCFSLSISPSHSLSVVISQFLVHYHSALFLTLFLPFYFKPMASHTDLCQSISPLWSFYFPVCLSIFYGTFLLLCLPSLSAHCLSCFQTHLITDRLFQNFFLSC